MRSLSLLIVSSVLFFASLVCAQTVLNPTGGGNAGAGLSGAATTPTSAAANCGQIELDIFNIAPSGSNAFQDVFQFISASPYGANFASQVPYALHMPSTTFANGVQMEIILSPAQGAITGPTGVTALNASIDTIAVTLNSQFTITQNYSARGNNFSFIHSVFPAIGANFVAYNFTVAIYQVFPVQQGLSTNSTCYSQYVLYLNSSAAIRGDPSFVGLRGQKYQVHGIDGGFYNLISDTQYQLNSLFSFLNGPRPCPIMPSTNKKSSACWAHAGSYIGELGLAMRDGTHIVIQSGSAHTGFERVAINDRTINIGDATPLVAFNTTHELVLTFGPWTIEVENSDSFLNLRAVHVDGSAWKTLRTHGLLGQTWNSKQYSGAVSAIEGDVDDYLIAENDLFGTNFVYNKF